MHQILGKGSVSMRISCFIRGRSSVPREIESRKENLKAVGDGVIPICNCQGSDETVTVTNVTLTCRLSDLFSAYFHIPA
jgi:hypothetical protein